MGLELTAENVELVLDEIRPYLMAGVTHQVSALFQLSVSTLSCMAHLVHQVVLLHMLCAANLMSCYCYFPVLLKHVPFADCLC